MTTLRIPDLVSAVHKLQRGIYPEYEEALQASEEWLASYNVMEPTVLKNLLNSGRVGLLTAMVLPFANKKSFRLALDLIILTFAYDDPFDEDVLMLDGSACTNVTNAIVSAITDTCNFNPVPHLPRITAYHDFIVRLRANSTPSTYERCVDNLVEYFLAVKKQIQIRECQTYPSIGEFALLRRATGGVKPFFTMAEVSHREDISNSVIQHPVIQTLLDISNDIICWTNDIFSFNKEQAKGEYCNLVSIVCIQKKIPVQSAIEYVFVMVESAIRRWFDVRAQIPKFDPHTDEIVSKYIEEIECSTSVFVNWHWEADRYLAPLKDRGEVKNALIKVLPLEPGSPEMPSDLMYDVIGFGMDETVYGSG